MNKSIQGMFDIDFSKLVSEFKFPGMDVEALTGSYRRNIEALTQANQLAMEGYQAIARRQVEILRQTLEEAQAMGRELVGAGSPDEKLVKETDLLKTAFEKALGNMTELAEMVSKSNKEAADIINKRVVDSLDEIKLLIEKQKAAK
jgi:phasin family protein